MGQIQVIEIKETAKKGHEMKTFEWIIFKNPLEARGLHPLGAPLVHPMKFNVLQYEMLTSKARV
jgi:hypothetical protein